LDRAIGPSILGSFLFGIGFLSLDTYVPLYVQGARGGGATAAASVVTPVFFTWAMSGIVAAPLIVRWGFHRVALADAALIVVQFSQHMMASGLIWVFAGMLMFAVLQLIVTAMMAPGKADHPISKAEAIEAMAG